MKGMNKGLFRYDVITFGGVLDPPSSGWVVVGKVMGLAIKPIDSDISNRSNDNTIEMKSSIC